MTSTYRVQLRPGFGFDALRARVGYLERLGVSHLYLSPIFESVPGSEHGYDVVDPTRIRGELGGEAGFERLVVEARSHGLGVLIDIVPNHMATHATNRWWWGTLRDGRESAHASIFDIDWGRSERVVLPVLGSPAGDVLERGELGIDRTGDEPALSYFDQRFPLRPDVEAPEGAIERLLGRQHYELVHWREGALRRNYRRFFDIDHLVGVRVEEEGVFERTHALVASLWREHLIDGVRIDHIDGLAAPGAYLERLEAMLSGRRPWIVVEKILGHGERLPASWRTHATTGYERLNAITHAFVDREKLSRMAKGARDVGADEVDFERLVRRSKREILDTSFRGELSTLASHVAPLVDANEPAVREALAEIIVSLDVYRTYLEDDPDSGRRRLEQASGSSPMARRTARALVAHAEREARSTPVRLFEQLSGPAMAKGLEDTAHYRHAVLTALNEVGGEPVIGEEGAVARFHAAFARAEGEAGLVPLSTHDTKRSEDARARLLALGEEGAWWGEVLRRVRALREPASIESIAPADLIFLLQAAIGIWPSAGKPDEEIAGRLRAFMAKCLREGKQRSSWTDPDKAYEGLAKEVCDATIEEGKLRGIVEETVARTRVRADQISLVQTVLRLTVPGVPDTYQGTEVIDRSLVDPDNRRPVDFDRLDRRLQRLDREGPEPGDVDDLKLHVTSTLLRLRRRLGSVLDAGAYGAIRTSRGDDVLAFGRSSHDGEVVVVCGLTLAGADATEIEVPIAGLWTDALSGETFGSPNARSIVLRWPQARLPAVALHR